MSARIPPAPCTTMAEVRSHIDALDERITALLVERTGYMTQAARIKQNASEVHDQARIDFIVERVRGLAAAQSTSPGIADVVEAAYQALIASSIAYEHREFNRLHHGEAP